MTTLRQDIDNRFKDLNNIVYDDIDTEEYVLYQQGHNLLDLFHDCMMGNQYTDEIYDIEITEYIDNPDYITQFKELQLLIHQYLS